MSITEEVLVSIYLPKPQEKGEGWYEAAMGRMKIKVDDQLTRDVAKNCLKAFIENFWVPNPEAKKPHVPELVIAGSTIPGCGLLYVNGAGEEMGMTTRPAN
ncbi:hypothetical protein [Streptomyces tubercidicus]|uniref:hypothetical protein n=1 Tax=Streptomyces tubercidicus TaxID=47759 RepID=UPI0036C380D1